MTITEARKAIKAVWPETKIDCRQSRYNGLWIARAFSGAGIILRVEGFPTRSAALAALVAAVKAIAEVERR